MKYFTLLRDLLSTLRRQDSDKPALSPSLTLQLLLPVILRIIRLVRDLLRNPVNPESFYKWEEQLRIELLSLGRALLESVLNQMEPDFIADMPVHIDANEQYTRTNCRTKRVIATTFGTICLYRTMYRRTERGGKCLFPLEHQLGIIGHATPALAERIAHHQAESGATQRRTLERLEHDHQISIGEKSMLQIMEKISIGMDEQRQDLQVAKLLELLTKADASMGDRQPVLCVGRDGITMQVIARKGNVNEVASTATITVYDRRGKRLGTVYLAYVPEPKQVRMNEQLTQLLQELLRQFPLPLPRLCYVTDAGKNETQYDAEVLRNMRHPKTKKKLNWIRVIDYYHVSERIWTMAHELYGTTKEKNRWAKKMLSLLLQPRGVRRVLNSAARLRKTISRPTALKRFQVAYNYIRERTRYQRYDEYRKQSIPCGSGVTEAGCKTIYTQRMKLSGQRWSKAGAQKVLNLRVALLSGIWNEGFVRILRAMKNVSMPTYAKLRENCTQNPRETCTPQ